MESESLVEAIHPPGGSAVTDKDCETAARVPHPPFGYCKDSEAVGSVWKADPATASRVAMGSPE